MASQSSAMDRAARSASFLVQDAIELFFFEFLERCMARAPNPKEVVNFVSFLTVGQHTVFSPSLRVLLCQQSGVEYDHFGVLWELR